MRFPKQNPKYKFENSQPPNLAEIQQIIKELKNDKAPGEDSIIAEMKKNVDFKTVKSLINK